MLLHHSFFTVEFFQNLVVALAAAGVGAFGLFYTVREAGRKDKREVAALTLTALEPRVRNISETTRLKYFTELRSQKDQPVLNYIHKLNRFDSIREAQEHNESLQDQQLKNRIHEFWSSNEDLIKDLVNSIEQLAAFYNHEVIDLELFKKLYGHWFYTSTFNVLPFIPLMKQMGHGKDLFKEAIALCKALKKT